LVAYPYKKDKKYAPAVLETMIEGYRAEYGDVPNALRPGWCILFPTRLLAKEQSLMVDGTTYDVPPD
jgi:hypothetical protein